MISYGFYNSVNHDRIYDAEDFSKMFDGVITDGVFESVGDKFTVIPNGGMHILVKSGRAWFDRTWTYNDSPLDLALSQSEVLYPRIDAIVLDVNKNESVRANSIIVVKGTPARSDENPVRPKLINEYYHKQYALAYITVRASTKEILSSDIINTPGVELPYASSAMSHTKIIDNLDSFSPSDALSANQGRVLNEKFGGLRLGQNSDGVWGYFVDSDFFPFKQGNAVESQVLSGVTFSNKNDSNLVGTMPNNSGFSKEIGVDGSVTIPLGYHDGTGKITGPHLTGNATTATVLDGYKYYSNSGTQKTGSMPNNKAVEASVGANGTYKIPAGYHNGNGTVTGPILSGNADASQVLAGKTFYSNSGTKKTGTMPNNGAWTSGTTDAGAVAIPEGYHNGSGYVSGQGAYNAGVTAADNRSNPDSKNYQAGYGAGRTQGQNDAKNSPNTYGLYSKSQYDANYNSGYNSGVRDADNRVNGNSVNYKSGYNTGYSNGNNDSRDSIYKVIKLDDTKKVNLSRWEQVVGEGIYQYFDNVGVNKLVCVNTDQLNGEDQYLHPYVTGAEFIRSSRFYDPARSQSLGMLYYYKTTANNISIRISMTSTYPSPPIQYIYVG